VFVWRGGVSHELVCSYMSANKLSIVPTGVFVGMTTLTTLVMQDNQITEVPLGAFDTPFVKRFSLTVRLAPWPVLDESQPTQIVHRAT
jgi:hypothetical protein